MQRDLRKHLSAVARFGPQVPAGYRVVVNDLRAFTGFDLEKSASVATPFLHADKRSHAQRHVSMADRSELVM
jgi:hypothetical protein